MADYNPIKWVNDYDSSRTDKGDGVTTNRVAIPCPSSYEWMKEYVSAADSGRTQSGLMQVNYVSSKVKIELEWQNVSNEVASAVLSAFSRWNESDKDSQYLRVTYLSPATGNYHTKTFYVGERKAVSYNVKLGVWESIGFSIIER